MATIVIVEDNDELREMAAGYLRSQGFVVETAPNGLHGLVVISRVVPDLIVSDISMPGMDGFELRRRLNELPGLASIPFLFMSAHHERERIREGMRLGADDYLTKPFTIADLLEAVKSRLARHEQAVQHESDQLQRMSESLQLIFPHEITTPISQVMAISQILPEMDAEEQAEYLAMMQVAAQRLNRLTLAFRDVTSLTMHQPDGSYGLADALPEAHDLTSDIQSWIQAVARDLEADHRVQASVSPIVSKIQPVLLQRVIVELLRNAITYSVDDVIVTVARTDVGVSVSVEDHGEGFDPTEAGNVVPFVQVDRRTTEQQGLGLGLYLTRRIAERFNGSLHIDSSAAGTKASVELADPG